MTTLQKTIVSHLLLGAFIHGNSKFGYRLLDRQSNCLVRFHYNTFHRVKPLLRKAADGKFLINKKEVRKHHGNSFAKKQYRLLNKQVA
jgi:hypothetical protein